MKTIIGIDPGVKTGMAIIDIGQYSFIGTMSILEAIFEIRQMCKNDTQIEIHIENPNLRKWYGKNSNAKQQGAGSIKRDYSIWVEFGKMYNIPIIEVAPKDIGSVFDNDVVFKAATKWKGRTSIHARDAARIIYRYYKG